MAAMTVDADIAATIEKLGLTAEPTGSRHTCSPPPIDTDRDFLIYVTPDVGLVSWVLGSKKVSDMVSALSGLGFRWEGSEHYQNAATNDFMSWRRGDLNLIVTANELFAKRHRAATHVCKTLNLLNKADRVRVFQAVLYGNGVD